MIYIASGYKTPTPKLEKKSLFLLKTEQGTSHDFDHPRDAMYDLYRWWVQNPNYRGGKKSLFLLKTEQGTSHDFDRLGDAHCNV